VAASHNLTAGIYLRTRSPHCVDLPPCYAQGWIAAKLTARAISAPGARTAIARSSPEKQFKSRVPRRRLHTPLLTFGEWQTRATFGDQIPALRPASNPPSGREMLGVHGAGREGATVITQASVAAIASGQVTYDLARMMEPRHGKPV